jgi:hypothetical protein
LQPCWGTAHRYRFRSPGADPLRTGSEAGRHAPHDPALAFDPQALARLRAVRVLDLDGRDRSGRLRLGGRPRFGARVCGRHRRSLAGRRLACSRALSRLGGKAHPHDKRQCAGGDHPRSDGTDCHGLIPLCERPPAVGADLRPPETILQFRISCGAQQHIICCRPRNRRGCAPSFREVVASPAAMWRSRHG